MGKPKRFQVIHNEGVQGALGVNTLILMDTVTGVLYLQVINGYAGGLTPLLDTDGKPMVWDLERLEATEE